MLFPREARALPSPFFPLTAAAKWEQRHRAPRVRKIPTYDSPSPPRLAAGMLPNPPRGEETAPCPYVYTFSGKASHRSRIRASPADLAVAKLGRPPPIPPPPPAAAPSSASPSSKSAITNSLGLSRQSEQLSSGSWRYLPPRDGRRENRRNRRHSRRRGVRGSLFTVRNPQQAGSGRQSWDCCRAGAVQGEGKPQKTCRQRQA